jgi:DNA-binding SARP family transcriptional activator/tetratricopeptide (TPR) repeat protein
MPARGPGTARVRLQLLGSPGATVDGRPLAAGSRKSLAVLAFVALEGRTTRARLAALFWPELDGASARRNLRRELHRLRGAGLDDALHEQGDGLALAPTVGTDVAGFEQALADGDLARAVAAYRGPFMDGLAGGDAAGLEAWATSWRDRLAQRYREAVEAQVSLHEAAWHWREALVCQLRLLDEDIPQEAHFRAAMRLHARLGEREAALHLFERCRRLLGRELGLRPMPQTLELAERIRRGEFDPSAVPAPPVAAAGALMSASPQSAGMTGAPGTPAAPLDPAAALLVGRETLLQRVRGALSAGRPLWLVGEAGAGKSALAQAAAARLGPVWTLQARPGDADQPHASVVRALRSGLVALDAPTLPAWSREALAHLLPELGDAHGRLADAGDRARLHAALALALRRLWPAGVAAVVLDDWHLADQASREFWQGQGRPDGEAWPGTGASAPALIVVGRDGDASPALRDAAADAQRRGAGELIEVPPLDASATAALLATVGAAAGWSTSPGLAERLHRATRGNPFFILETLRQGPPADGISGASGASGAPGASGLPGAPPAPELPLPPSVRDAVLSRLGALDDATRRLLEAASLIGLPFVAEDLAGTTALSDLEAVEAIERARAARVLMGDAQGTLAFAHDLVAQALADGLGPERRRLLHRRLARALERRGPAPARVAMHLEQAGDRAQALPWRLAAAEAAGALSAHDDALAHLDAALADAAAPADTLRVQLQRARLLQRASRPAEADAAFDAAEQAALDAGDGAGALGVSLARAEHFVCSNRVEPALATVDALLADELLVPSQQVEALEIRADGLIRQGALARADETLRDALARLPAGPSPLRGRLLTALGRTALYRGEFTSAGPWLEKAVRVHTALGAQEPLARALFMRGAALLNLGDFDAALTALERARTQAARAGSVPVQRGAILNLVKIHTQRGEVDRAVACLDEGEALSPLYESLEAEGAFLQARYYCHALRGELGRALALVPAVLAHADRCSELYWQVGARQLVVDLLLLLGDLDRAAALLAEAAGLCADDRDGHHRPLVEAKQAWCELLRGEPAAALARLQALGPVESMTMLEALDVRRHVEAAARLALGDGAGALALVADPARSSTEESKALQWAVRLRAEAALGGLAPDTRGAVEVLLADEARLPALEALALRQALAQALQAAGEPGAAAAVAGAEARRVALAANLGDAGAMAGAVPPRGVLAPPG